MKELSEAKGAAGQALGGDFAALFGAEAWRRLVAASARVEISTGAVLLRQGEPAQPLYFVESGSFEIVDARSAPETVVSLVGPGQVLGDMAFLDRAPASAEVRARSASSCLRWQRSELLDLLSGQPELAISFYRALASASVLRNRALQNAVMIGGFGVARPSRVDREAQEIRDLAAPLAAELDDAIGASPAGSPLVEAVRPWLTSVCRWFSGAGEGARAEEVGAELRRKLEELLRSAATSAMLLDRPEGRPAGPELLAHVLRGSPAGDGEIGEALDRALLSLPTPRGWAWRDGATAAQLERVLDGPARRVLWISLNGPCGAGALAALVASQAARIDLLSLEPLADGSGAQHLDLLALARGAPPPLAAPYDAVLLDRVCDLLPEETLRAFFAWSARLLAPAGELVVTHAVPAEDHGLLDHLLGWPSLPRRPEEIQALLPADGQARTLEPVDDEAAALCCWSSS